MGAVSDSVGVGVLNEGGFKDGHDHVAKCVMHHPISVGRSGNQPGFGFFDLKCRYYPGLKK